MASRRFQRRRENFTCANCGHEVQGTGYTNHCPECLWSRHVDVNPGDRAEKCQGMMRPIAIEQRGNERLVLHRCERCGTERRTRLAKDDRADTVLAVTRGHADRFARGQ